jgi:4-alpha-glucanotransferase
LHSEQSWGAGNWTDWEQFMEWAASLGGSVLATLPLTASFLARPICEPSPYSPASRLFWNEFYVDLTQVAEFGQNPAARKLVESAQFQKRLRAFRKTSFVDYEAQMAARWQVWELLAKFFFRSGEKSRRAAFASFLRARPDAEKYAAFRAACEQANAAWQDWPERRRNGDLRSTDYPAALQRCHLYAQWQAQEQFTRLVESSRVKGVKLFLDLPLGVHPASYDTWQYRQIFAMHATTGAPPDTFFSQGQNWGLAPLHPEKTRREQYRYVLDYLRFQMRHTGLLRIDHVMGLHRQYWIPKGFPATDGAYVSYPAEELYAILNLESHRHETLLVGEDLGTVPPQVKAGMKRHGLGQTYVLQYELRPGPNRAMRPPPAHAVAGLNTHDMPAFAAYWAGLDIVERVRLGLLKKRDLKKELTYRKRLNQNLVRMLQREGLKQKKPEAAAVFRACLQYLARSRAEIVLVNLEDFWGETRPQNIPGTWTERPNWRRKARLSLERIISTAGLTDLLERLHALRQGQ